MSARDKKVDDFFKNANSEIKKVAENLRDLILKAEPGIEEVYKWRHPVYSKNGEVCHLMLARDHITLGFWRGNELDDPKNLLTGTGARHRNIKVGNVAEIPKKEVTNWVKQAASLNKK